MSRTKRLYNSYDKYGKYYLPEIWFVKTDENPSEVKMWVQQFWHPYQVWCRGNCRKCRQGNPKHEDRRTKTTRKFNAIRDALNGL